MAGLKKMRGKFYIRVRKRAGYSRSEILIPCKTRLKHEAIARRIKVEKYEKDIKNGIIQEFQFKELFEWLNQKGSTKLIKKSLQDVVEDYLIYRNTKVRPSTASRDKCSLNQFIGFVGNKPIDNITYKEPPAISRLHRIDYRIYFLVI